MWTNLPNVSTSNVIAHMCHSKDIPRLLNFIVFQCKVWYKNQPIVKDQLDILSMVKDFWPS